MKLYIFLIHLLLFLQILQTSQRCSIANKYRLWDSYHHLNSEGVLPLLSHLIIIYLKDPYTDSLYKYKKNKNYKFRRPFLDEKRRHRFIIRSYVCIAYIFFINSESILWVKRVYVHNKKDNLAEYQHHKKTTFCVLIKTLT